MATPLLRPLLALLLICCSEFLASIAAQTDVAPVNVTIVQVQTPAVGGTDETKDESAYKGQTVVVHGVITAAFKNTDTKATWAFIQYVKSGETVFRKFRGFFKCEGEFGICSCFLRISWILQ